MSPVSELGSYRMTSPFRTDDGKTEAEPRGPYSSYFYCDNTNAASIGPYVDAFGNVYTIPTFTNASDYNISLPSNTWSAQPKAAAFTLQFASAICSPPIPTHYTPIPSTTSSNGIDTIDDNGWQIEADSSMQKSPGVPWDYPSWACSGSHNHTTSASRISKTGMSNTHNHRANSEFVSDTTAHDTGSQDENRVASMQPSPQRKRRKCGAAESSQKTSSKGELSGRTFAPMPTTDPSRTSISLDSDVSFDPPDTEEHTNPRPSRIPKRTRSSNETPQATQSPPATSRPGQRARNRTAAIKCRIKTKAAMAELEATEKILSSRHEQLCAALRDLQADVFVLKSEILLHGNCGDRDIQDYLNNAARSLTDG